MAEYLSGTFTFVIKYKGLIMKEYILVDSMWKLKRYLLDFDDREKIVIDSHSESKQDRLNDLLFSYRLLEKPIVIVKFVDEWEKSEIKWLIAACKRTDSDVIVSSKNSEILKKFGNFVDLSSPKPWDVKGWMNLIAEISETLSMDVKNDLKIKILERVGPNIDLLAQELKKLSIISKNPSLADVEEFVTTYTKPNLFEFCRSFMGRDVESVELLKRIVDTTHPLIVIRTLEKQLMTLAQMITQEKTSYSWDDVKKASKNFGVSIPQIADLVGFPLGEKRGKNLLKLWDFESVIRLLKDIQKVEIAVKRGEDPKFSLIDVVGKWTLSAV